MKKELFIVMLIVSLVFIVGCAEQITDEELNSKLDQLSEEEFTAVAEKESALVGEAKRPVSARVNTLRRAVKSVVKLPLKCTDDGEKLTFTRGSWSRSIPKFFCSKDNARERVCNPLPADGFTSLLTICEHGCDSGVCINLPATECTDSDDGKEIYKKGETIGCQDEDCITTIEHVDCCNSIIDGGFTGCSPTGEGIVEGTCDDEIVVSQYKECPQGCVLGACLRDDFIVSPSDAEITDIGDGRIMIQHNNFIHTTFVEYEAEGLIEIAWLEACYNKLWWILGIEPIGNDRIELNIIYDDGLSGGRLPFTTGTDEESIKMTKRITNLSQLDRYYNINYDTKPCYTESGKEGRDTTHELTHGFSGRRHPFQEGLAVWGERINSEPDYPIICRDDGFIMYRELGEPVSEWGVEEQFFNYTPYNAEFEYGDMRYISEYCFWKELEDLYGLNTIRRILKEGTEQEYLPPFTSEEGWDLMLREFLSEVVIPNTDESFKQLIMERYSISEEFFVPLD